MKLLGKEISKAAVLETLEERLKARGLFTASPNESEAQSVEQRVDPVSFNVQALEQHADATRPVPLHSHRHGVGRMVVWAKWAFRQSCQVFINETLARQRLFNGHVRDSYAQMSAEILRLRKELEEVKAQLKVEEIEKPIAEKAASPRRKTSVKQAR